LSIFRLIRFSVSVGTRASRPGVLRKAASFITMLVAALNTTTISIFATTALLAFSERDVNSCGL